jgi:hypothetical protein
LNDLAYSATIQEYGLNPTDIIVGKKYIIIEKNGMTSLLGKCLKIDFDAGNYQNDFSSKWVCTFEEEHPLNQPIYGYNNQKINILEWLNQKEQKPIKSWKEWILGFEYENAMDIIFEKDISSAIIHVFEEGNGELNLKNVENIPIRVFLQKKNTFYVYGKENSNDSEAKWYILTDDKKV